MAILTRFTDFVRGKLTHPNLDGEFDHVQSHVNRLLLANPLNRDLDFNGFLARNFRAKKVHEVRNAAEFSTIAAAIADIPSGTPGTIFLPANTTFVETATVTVPDDITIVGQGWSSVVKANLVDGALFDTADNSRIQFLNFKIDGDSQTTSAVPAIDASTTSGTDFAMSGVWITSWGKGSTSIATLRHGVDIRGNKNAKVYHNKFTTVKGSPIYCGANGSSPSDFSQLISWNLIRDAGQHGIYAWTGDNVKVVHNQISDADFCGIFLDANTTGTHRNVSVCENQIINVGNAPGSDYVVHGIMADLRGGVVHGLRIDGNQLNDVSRAAVTAPAGIGIFVNMDTASTVWQLGSISKNQIYNCQEQGIYVLIDETGSLLKGVVIDKNQIVDFSTESNAYHGIRVAKDTNADAGSVADVAVRNNTLGRLSATYTDGIRFEDLAGDNDSTGIISGNQIFGTLEAAGRPITITSADKVVVGPNAVNKDNSAYS